MRLKQVVLNLLSNAIKYNRDGGEVRIRVSQPDSQRVRIDVEDTGIESRQLTYPSSLPCLTGWVLRKRPLRVPVSVW